MEGVESIGDLVTGGAAARAVEPHAGEGRDQNGREAAHEAKHGCLNCGTELLGDFCHQCGQQGHVHRTLGAFGHDIAHSVLHFEGKMWRTLPLLAWQPGELTRRYVEGERARFVSPMALFLFSVFLMFAVVSALGGPIDTSSATPAEDRAEAQREYQKERAEGEAELRKLQAELQRARAAGEPTADIEKEIRGEQLKIRLAEDAFTLATRLANEEEARDSAQQPGEAKEGGDPAFNLIGKTGWDPLDKAVEKAEKNPSLLLYKLQTNAYKFSWALIPISVPFVWLLFLHRRRYRQYKAYDHVVFVTYSIAFMTIGFTTLTLLRPLGLGEAIIGAIITFGPPFHMYRQLRGAYRLSRWSAIWRTFLLINFAFIAVGLFFTLLLGVGAFG